MTVTDAVTQLAFVGQSTYFAPCAAQGRHASFEARFIDFRKGMDPTELVRQLDQIAPEVVVVFKPETIPHGLFADLEAVTVGYLTEPLPGRADDDSNPHADLARRLRNLRSIDASNFDRIITYNPRGTFWRISVSHRGGRFRCRSPIGTLGLSRARAICGRQCSSVGQRVTERRS